MLVRVQIFFFPTVLQEAAAVAEDPAVVSRELELDWLLDMELELEPETRHGRLARCCGRACASCTATRTSSRTVAMGCLHNILKSIE